MRKGKEAQYFLDIKAEYMSDEEKCSDGTYIRHPPMYRSVKFDSFLKKLDERAEKSKKQHARFQRREGSPHDVPIPEGIKTWMLNDKYRQRMEDNEHELSASDNENGLDGEESDEESGSSCEL